MQRTSRSLVSLALVLALTACGGDDDAADEPAVEPSDEPAAEPADEPAAEPTDEPGAGEAMAGDNVAIVTIGDRTYEFDVTPGATTRCDPDFFGAFWATGGSADGARLEALLPPPDDPNFDEMPRITVNDPTTDRDWTADPLREMAGVEEGESQVDEFTTDGTSASGSATFVDQNESFAFQGGSGVEPVPVTGTFEVRCAG